MTATLTAPARRELRDYQLEAVGSVYNEWEESRLRVAIVMATGLGKTDVIATVATRAARAGKRVLILAHRAELLDQITERCQMHAPEVGVGRVQAQRHESRRPITVAMAPTMRTEKRRARMTRPDVVIVDECHHAASPSYVSILEWAGAAGETVTTPLLGVTATLTRGDKKHGLADVFDEPPFTRDTAWAIEQGWLVRPHGRCVVTSHMDLDKAKVSKGDYQDGELGDMVAQDVEEIVKAWQNLAEDRITVAFTPNVDSAEQLAATFRAQGVATGEVYGHTPQEERRRTYADLGAGRIRVLVSVMVTTEGWDCPPVSCVLMARPTKLAGLYQQIVGRGLRLSPDTGKTDCLVLDVVGASRSMHLRTLVDLLPSAKYDRTEVDLIACDVCGGHVGRGPKVRAAVEEQGLDMEPCGCPCEGCGSPFDDDGRCECPPPDRDPDGGRIRLQGPATYAELDLLGLSGDGGSDHNWLRSPEGVPFLTAGDRIAAVHQEDNGLWTAAVVKSWGAREPEVLIEYASLEHARALVEQWADRNGHYGRRAPWRHARERATPKQQAAAANLGITNPEQYTKGGISDVMDMARASRQFFKNGAPS